MNQFYIFIALLLSALIISNKGYGGDEFPTLEGPYLGQKPPGLIPEAFAPSIVTTERYEYNGVFTQDMKAFYFRRAEIVEEWKPIYLVMHYRNNRWSEPTASPYNGNPVFSPGGSIMHFGKYYKERTEAGWSETKSLGSLFEDIEIMRLTSSSRGTYVFDEVGSRNEDGVLLGDSVLRYSRMINGEREAPKPLDKAINTGKWNAHPFIAPDESYLIFDSEREGGYGDSDLYISYRQQDGSWSEAINLGDKINTDASEASATVTPDGKYLFFNRNMGSDNYENVDIFWVNTQFVEALRPK